MFFIFSIFLFSLFFEKNLFLSCFVFLPLNLHYAFIEKVCLFSNFSVSFIPIPNIFSAPPFKAHLDKVFPLNVLIVQSSRRRKEKPKKKKNNVKMHFSLFRRKNSFSVFQNCYYFLLTTFFFCCHQQIQVVSSSSAISHVEFVGYLVLCCKTSFFA